MHSKNHYTNDLALAISVEAAELNELFLWKTTEESELVDRNKLKEELADVFAFSLHTAGIHEVTLETQYRCMGSNDYLLWLESVLGYTDDKRIFRKDDQFDFRIFDSPQAIMDVLNEKEKEKPNSARMVAGFCWPWSNKTDNTVNLLRM